jgi:hypothetical protein
MANESTSIAVADAGDLKSLETAAVGLSQAGIWAALNAAGVDAGRGLAGVPRAKVWAACSALQVSFRTDPVEPLDARTRFERAGVDAAAG